MSEATQTSNPCPRCGSPIPATTGGVCLRCLGERALRLTPGDDPSADIAELVRTTGEPESPPPRHLGAYELIDEIGRGGMGAVYTARHRQLGTIVALKIIGAGRFATAEQEMRFVREAQTAARLKHPNIVVVHDAGQAEGVAYFTMDVIPDGDLAERMRENPLSPRAAAGLIRKVADAVAHAHANGVLHRDLKPSNILLDGDEPRVADFGIASEFDEGAGLTMATRMLGTPSYMAPEVFSGGTRTSSPASDIYGVGAILYELLTGKPPRQGPETMAADFEPVAPRLLAPGVPRDLETICLKCISRSPASRYETARELAEDIARFLEGHAIHARPVSGLGRFLRWCRRKPALAAVWFLMTAIAVGASVAAVIVSRARDEALRAEHEAADRSWDAQLAQAKALRGGKRIGQRLDALDALASAARLRVTPELRDAAIGALAQVDLRPERRWTVRTKAQTMWRMTPDFSADLREVRDGVAELRTQPGDELLMTLDGSAWGRVVSAPEFDRSASNVLLRYRDDNVRIWSLRDGKVFRTVALADNASDPASEGIVYDFAWMADDSRFVVAAPDGGLAVHSRDGAAEPRHWSNGKKLSIIAVSPTGDWIATVPRSEPRVLLLDAATLEPRQEFATPAVPRVLAFRPDGAELAIGCEDGVVRVVRPGSEAPPRSLIGHRAAARHAIYSNDGRMLVTSGRDATVRIWDGFTGEPEVVVPGIGGPPDAALSPDGRRFAVSQLDTTARLFEVLPNDVVRTTPAARVADRGGLSAALDFSPDGKWLAVATWSGVYFLDAGTGMRVAADLSTTNRDEHSVRFSPDGLVFLSSRNRGLWTRRISVASGRAELSEPKALSAESGWLLHTLSADGSRAVLGNRRAGEIRIVQTTDGAIVHDFNPQPQVMDATLSKDGRWLVTQCTGIGDAAAMSARLWSTSDWTMQREFDLGPLGMVTFSRDGRWLAVAGAQGFRAVRTADWSEVAGQWPDAVNKAGATSDFTADGALLAVTVDDKVYLIRSANGEKIAVLESPTGNASTARAKLSGDGSRLAVLWDDASVDIWDLARLRSELAKRGLDW